MKRLKLFSMIAVFTFLIFTVSSLYAASTSLSGTTNVTNGDNVTITINGSAIAVWDLDVSYDDSKLELISGKTKYVGVSDSGKNENITIATLVFKTKGTGTANVGISGTISGEDKVKLDTSRSIGVSINEKVVTPPDTGNNDNQNNNNSSNNNSNSNTTVATKSSNAYLKSLQVNYEGLTPNFNKNKTTYSLSVGKDVDSIKVTAKAEHSGAKVSVSGNTNLKDGDNNVYITVTAENGAKKTYTIVVTKSADPDKANSYLESLIVENAKLSPEFSKEIFEYDCGTVGLDVTSLKILAFPEIEEAKVEITGNDELIMGENNIVVKITSVDGTTTKEYKIRVIKEEVVDALSNNDEGGIKLVEEDNSKLSKIIQLLKDNALLILMYIFILVEFIQIVYLYRKLNKNKDNDENDKKDASNKIIRGRSGALNNNDMLIESNVDAELELAQEQKNNIEEPKIELKLDFDKINASNNEEDNTIKQEENIESKYEEYLDEINNTEDKKVELNLNFDDKSDNNK